MKTVKKYINKQIMTIVGDLIEMCIRDRGYTWGRLQSGQGWIALDYTERIEGEKKTQSESSGMNIQEIQTGNFSSVKGSWRNEQGNSITFDANGLIQVNGKPAGDVVFDKFVVKGEKLTACLLYTSRCV